MELQASYNSLKQEKEKLDKWKHEQEQKLKDLEIALIQENEKTSQLNKSVEDEKQNNVRLKQKLIELEENKQKLIQQLKFASTFQEVLIYIKFRQQKPMKLQLKA